MNLKVNIKNETKKRSVAIFVVTIMLFMVLTACSSGEKNQTDGTTVNNEELKIVTTIFPVYDLTRNITDGIENINIDMLLDNGVDLHSYQPTAQDIMEIASCDIFIYVGGESDSWVDDALYEAVNEDMVVVSLLDELGEKIKEEDLIEGMEAKDETEDEDDDIEYDEHVWLSIKNMENLCERISDAIQKVDPDNSAKYEANAKSYIEKLAALDEEYAAMINDAKYDTLLFGDRFPFRYLTDDYGLKYYAAFTGCSAETEASFETVTFLAKKVDELSLPAVITIEGTEHRIAQTVIENTKTKDQQIISLDSMQSITAKDVEEGKDYISLMKKNLESIRQALN